MFLNIATDSLRSGARNRVAVAVPSLRLANRHLSGGAGRVEAGDRPALSARRGRAPPPSTATATTPAS